MENNLNIIKREIRTKGQFRALLDGMMKKQQITIPSIEIDLDRGRYTTALELTNTPISRIYVNDKVIKDITVRNGSRIVNIKNKFTWDFLSVSVTNESACNAEAVFGSNIYLVHATNGWVKIFSDLGSEGLTYTDLENGKISNSLPNGEVHIYRGLAWTASNKRQKTMVFMEITHEDRRFKVLDNATLGALSDLRNKYGMEKCIEVFMALQKAGGYVGNVLTGSVNFGRVTGYVRYFSKWENDTNETFLTAEYDNARNEFMEALRSRDNERIKAAKSALDTVAKSKASLKDVPTQDGQMYVNARVFAEMIESKFGLVVDPKVLTGIMIQLRPGTIKASALVVSEEIFMSTLEGTKAIAEKRNQKIEYVGDVNNLLYIADKNCIKLDYDMEREITLEILAFAKCSEGKTSIQLAETVMYAANELRENGAQLLYDILKLSVDKKTASLTVDKKSRLMTPEEINKALNSKYVNDFVMAIAPRFIEESKPFYNSSWRQSINSVTNMISGLNGAITSHNRRLSSDPTFILTGGKLNSILNTGEVVINDRRLTKVVMIKYPKMGLREFYFAKNVTIKTIRKRLQFHVNKGIISQAEADKVVRFYIELDSFIAVLPAKSVITFACAGLDFDYDGALFLEYTKTVRDQKDELTNKVIDLLERTRMKAVVIQN